MLLLYVIKTKGIMNMKKNCKLLPLAAFVICLFFSVSVMAQSQVKSKTEKCVVTLVNVGPNKLKVVKAVKETLGLGLRESKDLVDAAMDAKVVLVEDVTPEKAAEIKTALENEGATVVISRKGDNEVTVGR